jgi:hypothetical protein
MKDLQNRLRERVFIYLRLTFQSDWLGVNCVFVKRELNELSIGFCLDEIGWKTREVR